MRKHQFKKNFQWTDLNRQWTEPDHKEQIVEYVMDKQRRIGISSKKLLNWLGISRSKYYDWLNKDTFCISYNGIIPKSHWSLHWEQEAVISYAQAHPTEGYRRLPIYGSISISDTNNRRILKSHSSSRFKNPYA